MNAHTDFIKGFIIKYLNRGVVRDDSFYEIRKVNLINIFHFIALMALIPLGILALYRSLDVLGFMLLGVALILFINCYYFKFSKNKILVSYVMVTLLFILYIYLVYTGGFKNTGPLWIYTLPMVSMFLLGFRTGLVYIALFFVVLMIILFEINVPIYSYGFKLRLVLSLLVVTFLASVYEYLQEKTFLHMHNLSKELEEASYKDYLTQIYNRRGVDKELKNIYAHCKKNNHHFSLMVCDIDYFKKINDYYGHIVGDEVLKKVVLEIKNIIRKDDVLARWGGEEFLVLLPDTSIDDAYKVAEKIRKTIENTLFTYNNHTIKMTVSLGIAKDNNALSISEVISQADAHMYAAKRQGRNIVHPRPKELEKEH